MKAIEDLHQQIDQVNDQLARATARAGRPVTCQGKGCCACCYEPVYCSSHEAKHLVEGLTDEQRAAVTARLRIALAKAKESGILEIEMPPVMQWLSLELACPLLENGLCLAYERRPVSCRTHMASGPADHCKYNRLGQVYPQAKEAHELNGKLIIQAHLNMGNFILNDNLLALLSGELLGEYSDTASAEKIIFE